MARKTQATHLARGDSLPPAGTGWPPEATCARSGSAAKPSDDLGREITTLKALHPKLQLRFRDTELEAMDTKTKLLLLQDIREALGIAPLKRRDL